MSETTDKLELRGLLIGDEGESVLDLMKEALASTKIQWSNLMSPTFDNSQLQELMSFPYSVLTGESCLKVGKHVKRRSVGSHFLNYIDFIQVLNGELWGGSLFSEVFREALLHSIRNQDFKGAVIFLGHSSLALPAIQVLATFGFEEFVFLEDDKGRDYSKYQPRSTGLINTSVSSVDSGAFIQSEKSYSLCFVMQEQYPRDTLDDMSYFHFLSTQSMVFDLNGRSNFLFKEVKALGVEVIEFKPLFDIWSRRLLEMISQSQKHLSKDP